MNLKKAGFIFVYIVFLAALSAAALEIGARIKYQKSYLAANIRFDRTYHHLLPPNTPGPMSSEGDFNDTFVTNNAGMRGPGDYAVAKKPGAVRVAIMGDSFTFGVGVKAEETFSARLQQMLDPSAQRVEVLNFGVSSFSPAVEYIYFKHEVLHYNPDALVLALDLCDLQDDYQYEKRLVHDKDGDPIACDPYIYNGRWDLWAALKRHSIFITILDEKLIQSIHKMRVIGFARYFRNKREHIRNRTEILTNPDIDNIEFDRFLFTRENKNPEVIARHWQRTASYILRIKRLCDDNSVRFVLAAYPYGHQVGTNQWAKGRQYWGFANDKVYDASRPFETIGAFARDNGIEFVSMLEPMLESNAKKLYYNNDGHWTAEGHWVAAYALLQSETLSELAREGSNL